MEIRLQGNNPKTFVIYGQIKTFLEYEEIKEMIEDYLERGGDSLHIHIKESNMIISSLVGFLIKQTNQHIKVYLSVKEDALWKTLENLGLLEAFHVCKTGT
jgi:uncharacterized protein YbcI